MSKVPYNLLFYYLFRHALGNARHHFIKKHIQKRPHFFVLPPYFHAFPCQIILQFADINDLLMKHTRS